MTAGIPGIGEAGIEVSAEISTETEWNDTTTKEIEVLATGTVLVPAKSSAVVHYVGTRGTCDVPFSYTQRDRSSTDGKITQTEQIDGVFTGVNNYGFKFTVEKYQPLPDQGVRIKELVSSRKIYEVRYRMQDARIFGETPYVGGTTSVINESDEAGSIAVTLTYTNVKSRSFSLSTSVAAGQEDRSSTSGEIIYTDQIDGVFTGVNAYNFQFIVERYQPLD
ncbi:hypothetical protein SASPL_150156 [Salvia splendens]|uniref:Uncharacterized protein n=1 Tax=Salvia splendens TaxID=180675 RepID=A0A8X8Z2E4_SALSN|nr:hypothetical protein SASPL_150156 [Salvia splendens]